jgi:hypothetical protein
VLQFFERGGRRLQCETRLSPHGDGYELVITEDGREHIERFKRIGELLTREHELLTAWRAIGWRQTDSPRWR